jgi:mutator protein MutT
MNVSGAVAVFILNNNNELLVCRRAHDPAKGTLDLPGGFVDLHETAEEAVMREIEEETGLIISELTYKFSLPNQYLYSDFEVHTLDLFYQATANDTTALEANDDVEDCKFVAINELQPTDFGLKSIRIAIDRFIKEQNNR